MSELQPEKFSVRARYNNITKYIYFSELNTESFLDEACKEFKLSGSLKMLLSDNVNAAIHPTKFAEIYRLYGNQASFFINIMAQELVSAPVVTPNELEDFLNMHCEDMLALKDETLNNSQTNRLIRHVAAFAQFRFGLRPGTAQQNAIVSALQLLFPKVDQNSIRNTKDGGKLGICLRNKRFADKDKLDERGQNVPLIDDSIDEDTAKLELEMLKSMVVNKENMIEIQNKLKLTLSYRMNLLKQLELNIREYFPYFFVSAELISYEFSLHYPDTEENAFDSAWSLYSTRVIDVLKNHFSRDIDNEWSTDVTQLLAFFKLLPSKVTKNNLLSIQVFKKAIDKLIVFRKKDCALNQLIEAANKFPYIIAVGNSKKQLTHFYIEVEREILNVPIGFTIGQTFDLFFKIHKIFRMTCDTNLQKLFHFCEHYVYKTGNSNDGKRTKKNEPTSAMQTLHNLLTEEH